MLTWWQVLEVLADDTNFRAMAMELCAGPAAAMLTQHPGLFESAWCAGAAYAVALCAHLHRGISNLFHWSELESTD